MKIYRVKIIDLIGCMIVDFREMGCEIMGAFNRKDYGYGTCVVFESVISDVIGAWGCLYNFFIEGFNYPIDPGPIMSRVGYILLLLRIRPYKGWKKQLFWQYGGDYLGIRVRSPHTKLRSIKCY